MLSPLPTHSRTQANMDDRSFASCNYLARQLTLLSLCIGDGVLVVAETARMLAGVGIKGSTRAVKFPFPLPHISVYKQSSCALVLPIRYPTAPIPCKSYFITHHHVYFLLPVPAHGLAASQRPFRQATASATTQPQLVRLQPVFSLTAGTSGECVDIWRRPLFQCFQPVRW